MGNFNHPSWRLWLALVNEYQAKVVSGQQRIYFENL